MRKILSKNSSCRLSRWLAAGLALIGLSAWASPVDRQFVDPDPLPRIALSQNVLYQIMASEIAIQKSMPGTAYQTFMDTARQTQDPRLAQRAYSIAQSLSAFPEALEAANLWLKCAPNSFAAEQARIFTLARMGRLTQTELDDFAQLRKFARNDAKKHRSLLENFVRQVALSPLAPAQAIALIENNLGSVKPSGTIALALSELYRKNRQTDIALLLAKKAYQDLPERASALLQYADLAYTSNPPKVIEQIEDFVKKRPHDAEALMGLAKAYAKFGDAKKAIKTVKELESIAGNNPAVLFLLAGITQAVKDPDQTQRLLKAFEKAAEHQPAYAERLAQARNTLGWLALDKNAYEEALSYGKLIQELPAYQQQARFMQAQALYHLGQYPQSIKLLKQLEKKNPDLQVLMLLASAHAQLQQWKTTHQYWEKALKLQPQNKHVLYQTGIYAGLAGKVSRAQTLLRQGIQQYPTEPHFYNSLGYLYVQHQIKNKEAEQLIRTALKLEPNSPIIQDSMGWWYFMNQQYEQAEIYLSMAAKSSQETEIWLHLIELYLKQGKKGKAEQYLLQLKDFCQEPAMLEAFLKRWNLK